MFADHLPALQVLLPLMGAPLCFLLRKEALASAFTVAISFACLAISVSLLGQTMDGHVLVYEFGGWPRPFGIEYRIDITNAFVLVVVSLVAAPLAAPRRAAGARGLSGAPREAAYRALRRIRRRAATGGLRLHWWRVGFARKWTTC